MTPGETVRGALFVAMLVSTASAGCNGNARGAALGASCVDNGDCASGMCIDTASTTSYCSDACTMSSDCTSTALSLVCDSLAHTCVRRCDAHATRGTGAATEVCGSAGVFVTCASGDSLLYCADCGCEPFGGGTCIDGAGCVQQHGDGESCTRDVECTSGVCYRDTSTCGAPRPMGGDCTVDVECAMLNCSTDGATGVVGHCNQQLGTICSAPQTGHNVTDTCTDCYIYFGSSNGVCLRDACDLTRANHCPDFDGHEFRCERATSGEYHCFEWCETDRDYCYFDSISCYRADDYCR